MKPLFIFIIFLLPLHSWSQVEDPLVEKLEVPTQETIKDSEVIVKKKLPKLTSTEDFRTISTGTLIFGYQPITTWIPSKKLLSYTHIFSNKWSAEFEYAWAKISFPVLSIDIGDISEKRFSLQMRNYFGNSFHLIFGGYRNEFRVRVGNDILARMSNANIDVFSVENMGATFGLGNRWQAQNGLTWGVDWFRINAPLFGKKTDDKILTNTSDESDKDDIKKITRSFESFPTFVLLGINIGYTF